MLPSWVATNLTVIGGKAGGGLESTDVVLVLYTNDRLHSLAVLLRQRELPRHAEGPRKVGFRDDRKHNLTVTNAILHALWALVRRIDFEPTALAERLCRRVHGERLSARVVLYVREEEGHMCLPHHLAFSVVLVVVVARRALCSFWIACDTGETLWSTQKSHTHNAPKVSTSGRRSCNVTCN